MKQTQKERVLSYLRKHKRATNYELIVKCGVMCPWRRIAEIQDEWVWNGQFGPVYTIKWRAIKTKNGARVTQYTLERIK